VINYAVVVAAGTGRRFGGEKQFCEFQGQPLIMHAVTAFEKSRKIDRIIVVVPKSRTTFTARLIGRYRLRTPYTILAGGTQRYNSVACALNHIETKKGIVAIHDGVRPIVHEWLIEKGMQLCRKYGAVVFGTPITDTLKQVKSHRITGTIARQHLYTVQTPQFFMTKLIKKAYENSNPHMVYTDDASVLESCNIPVYLFSGDRLNLKVTRKQDLTILAKLT
jgi:2-C-methyl-D-erythritol 4-phosphate cytidylyltransferase